MYAAVTVTVVELGTFVEACTWRLPLDWPAGITRLEGTGKTVLVLERVTVAPPAGAAVLKAATRVDAPRVDRLLAVWSKTLDLQRPLPLGEEDPDRRRFGRQPIAPAKRRRHRDKIMVPVRPRAHHGEEEIDLRRGKNRE